MPAVDPNSLPTQTFEWGSIKWLVSPDSEAGAGLTLGEVVLLPGKGHDRHNHPESEEVLYVLSGEGEQTVDDGAPFRVQAGSTIYVPTAVFHVLVALADRDRHGYSIMQDVAARTDGKVRLSAGTLYSAVRRMLEQGLIEELRDSPDPASEDERRRYYRLTRLGRNVAVAEARRVSDMLAQARATGLIPRKL